MDCPQYAYIVRDLCYFRDYADPFVLTSTEIVQLIEYLCTIYISKLISLGDIISYLYYKPVYSCVSSCAEMTCIIMYYYLANFFFLIISIIIEI